MTKIFLNETKLEEIDLKNAYSLKEPLPSVLPKNASPLEIKKLLVSGGLSTAQQIDLIKQYPQVMRNFHEHEHEVYEQFLSKLFEASPELFLKLKEDYIYSPKALGLINDPNILALRNQELRARFVNDMSERDKINHLIEIIGIDKTKEIVHSLTFEESGEILPLMQSHPELYENLSDAIKIREAAHRLGLKGNIYESFYTDTANFSTNRRFQLIAESTMSNLSVENSINLISIHSKDQDFHHLNTHGDITGIHAEWSRHAFSFHFVKEKDKTHIIYVNRGQQHELAKADDSTVFVFTFDDTAHPDEVIEKLHQVLKTKDKTQISQFIQQDLTPHLNATASKVLEKSRQKVGNCSIANANIAWHFKLATDLMKSNPNLSFTDAYQQMTSTYKAMRMEDRADAFCTLVRLRDPNALKQIMIKMHQKDQKDPQRQTVAFLVNKLNEQNPNDLIEVLNQIVANNLIDDCDASLKLQWVSEIIRLLPEEYDKTLALAYQEKCLFPVRIENFLKTNWSLLNEEQTASYINQTDPSVLKDCINNFKPSFQNHQCLIKILMVKPEYIQYMSLKTTKFLIKTASIDHELSAVIGHFLSNHLIDDAALKEIVSEAESDDADRLKHLFSIRPDLMDHAKEEVLHMILLTGGEGLSKTILEKNYLKPETIIEVLTCNVLSESARHELIRNLHEDQLIRIVKSLSVARKDHQGLASTLFAIHPELIRHESQELVATAITSEKNTSNSFVNFKQKYSMYRNSRSDQLSAAYAELGLFSTATDREVKQRYNELVLAHHPDKTMFFSDAPAHLEKFKAIDEAYKYIVDYRQGKCIYYGRN